MRMLVAILCWATWLCAMVAIVSMIAETWRDDGADLSMKMAGVMVLMLYLAGAAVGVKAFQMLWPHDPRYAKT